jgi:predicted phosphodiesterase
MRTAYRSRGPLVPCGVRVAIVSDCHSNTEGLAACLDHAAFGGPLDAVWCAGDVVGYGPEPSAVIAALRAHPLVLVAGNHDLAACGRMDVDAFNPAAASAALWSRKQLSADERNFLAGLPLTVASGAFTIVHGSLMQPEWEYLLTAEQALSQFSLQRTPYSIIGHSHLPFWMEERPGRAPHIKRADDGDTVALGGTRLILNPGSTGQPRDGDPRASYMLYDDAAATVTWRRVGYDIVATQRKMRDLDLHPWLIERLALGQ